MSEEIKNGQYKYPNRVEFYLNGEKHREEGPAVEWKDGGKEWWFEGKRHNEDGPAIEMNNGAKYWYIFGKQYTEADFSQWKMKKELNEKLQNNFELKPSVKTRKI